MDELLPACLMTRVEEQLFHSMSVSVTTRQPGNRSDRGGGGDEGADTTPLNTSLNLPSDFQEPATVSTRACQC